MASTTSVIDESRLRRLNERPPRDGAYVLYWMQQSQRAESNHALEYAAQRANERGLPLVVGFGLTDGYPEANARHFRFMLEGLAETADALRRRGMGFVLRRGDPADVALELAADAALVVCDRGYLRHQRAWRRRVADQADCEVARVEADAVVPVDQASDKREYAARTIRPRLHRLLDRHLLELRTTSLDRDAARATPDGESLADVAALLDRLDLDRSVPPVHHLHTGGTAAARAKLDRFLDGLEGYDEHRNQPETDDVSGLGMHLHFGQISPLYVALRARDAHPVGDRDSFLEELIVRRELAMNYCRFEKDYDRYRALPEWARATLEKHRDDPREHVYTERELEHAETHDPYWNAAMREMRYTGYMHNAMRMYWGKKIIEWTNTPRHAYRVALRLNNRYFLDGRDPASFANIGWLFGLHDRPWAERDIFGTVRYMSARGLERKSDIDAYVRRVDERVEQARAAGVTFD